MLALYKNTPPDWFYNSVLSGLLYNRKVEIKNSYKLEIGLLYNRKVGIKNRFISWKLIDKLNKQRCYISR